MKLGLSPCWGLIQYSFILPFLSSYNMSRAGFFNLGTHGIWGGILLWDADYRMLNSTPGFNLLDASCSIPLPHHSVTKISPGNSLVVQWVGLCILTTEGSGSIPGWGPNIPHAVGHGHKKKKKKRRKENLAAYLKYTLKKKQNKQKKARKEGSPPHHPLTNSKMSFCKTPFHITFTCSGKPSLNSDFSPSSQVGVPPCIFP